MTYAFFQKNKEGNDYVVGDIHGKFSKLLAQLDESGFNKTKDRLFSVGDLVDRGEESNQVLVFLRENKNWFFPVLGNHEQMAIDAYEGWFDRDNYRANGGGWWFGMSDDEKQRIHQAFSSFPVAIEVEGNSGNYYGIVHADCCRNDWTEFLIALNEEYERNDAIWNRSRLYVEDKTVITGIDRVYHGHTPLKDVVFLGNRVYIDNAAWNRDVPFVILELE